MLKVGWQKQVITEARRLQAGGSSQGADWSLAETLLAFLLCVYSDPSRLGGTKSTKGGDTRQHPGVVALAKALGRLQRRRAAGLPQRPVPADPRAGAVRASGGGVPGVPSNASFRAAVLGGLI